MGEKQIMPTMKILNTAILISLLLSGCMGGKETILPQDGPTMLQVYEGHFSGKPPKTISENEKDKKGIDTKTSESEPINGRFNSSITLRQEYFERKSLSHYTRTAENEIQQIFPRLKNKTLIMYIFPHLTKRERNPVPGYSTAFTLYKQTEYALPGEDLEGY